MSGGIGGPDRSADEFMDSIPGAGVASMASPAALLAEKAMVRTPVWMFASIQAMAMKPHPTLITARDICVTLKAMLSVTMAWPRWFLSTAKAFRAVSMTSPPWKTWPRSMNFVSAFSVFSKQHQMARMIHQT